jgi:four helix bundle protein
MAPNTLRSLAVYRGAIHYVAQTRPLTKRLKREDPTLADQLHRSVISIPLNIAEGSGEFSPKDKARFYRYALRSCAESLAILDVSKEIGLVDEAEHAVCFSTGDRITAMLTRLVVVTTSRAHGGDRPRVHDREADAGSNATRTTNAPAPSHARARAPGLEGPQ